MPSTLTTLARLTDQQRDDLNSALERDGYVILPDKLPEPWIRDLIAAMDRIVAERREHEPGKISVKVKNCVDLDSAFLRLMMYEPALQLSYDVLGPMFHLCQSNFVSRAREQELANDFVTNSPWHADGPRPGMFPRVNGTMGLHYLKFGYFLTDLRHGNGGSLMVVRGSHKRPELDGDKKNFQIERYGKDLVKLDCEPGTMVAFNQAQWHAAPANESDIERKNLYYSYCPTWMRPLDREFPTEAQLAGRSAEERWLLGEPRPATRWWMAAAGDVERMARFRRDGATSGPEVIKYD